MKKGIFLFVLFTITNTAYSQEIKSVNFTQEGEVSKLVIEADKDLIAERFHVTEDKQIILDIRNAKVSPKLLRGIDTSEFPGSTVYISGYKKPGTQNDIRFAIQLRDNVRSVLEVKQNSIILNIENRFGVFSKQTLQKNISTTLPGSSTEDTVGLHVPRSDSIEDILHNLTLSGPKKYIGKRISINVRDIPVPDLLNMIVDTSGFNIIIDQEIAKRPPLSLTLTNVPWDQALDTIMQLSKLVARKNANILIVKTEEQEALAREAAIKENAQKQDLEPLVTRVFLINYAAIKDLEKIVKDYLTPNRSALQVDERTNSLIVKDTVDSIERIKKIIETLDTQTPQIMIEAKIVEASEVYSKKIGLNRGISFGYDPIRENIPTPNGPGFSFSSAPIGGSATALGMTIGVYKRLFNLDLNLQLMESESKGRVISTPRIVTQNKKSAEIVSSEITSYATLVTATTTTPAQQSFNRVTADLSLKVTPQVTNEGTIGLEIELSKSAFGTKPSASAPPDMTERQVKTGVLVDNGSTIVIGGLYQTTSLEQRSGIPYLKDLPLIGWLFSTPYAPDTTKNELIIFMTPRIMNDEELKNGTTQAQTSTPKTGI